MSIFTRPKTLVASLYFRLSLMLRLSWAESALNDRSPFGSWFQAPTDISIPIADAAPGIRATVSKLPAIHLFKLFIIPPYHRYNVSHRESETMPLQNENHKRGA